MHDSVRVQHRKTAEHAMQKLNRFRQREFPMIGKVTAQRAATGIFHHRVRKAGDRLSAIKYPDQKRARCGLEKLGHRIKLRNARMLRAQELDGDRSAILPVEGIPAFRTIPHPQRAYQLKSGDLLSCKEERYGGFLLHRYSGSSR